LVDIEQNPYYLELVRELLGVTFDPASARWLTSLDQNGRVLGIVVFSRFNDQAAEITVVSRSPRFLSRKFFITCLAYAFRQCKLRRVTAFIQVGNSKSLSLAQQLGFREEGIARKWFSTGDAHILGLLPEDCKWLKEFNGFAEPTASS
jgi:RimJ/RimL family protein N-acetyltransferase